MPDSEAVTMWRQKFKLNLNLGRKADIDATIQDLELWKYVLDNWGYWKAGKWVSFSPLSVGKQLSEYERLEHKRSSQSALAYTSGTREIQP